jgi:hypothetical protein
LAVCRTPIRRTPIGRLAFPGSRFFADYYKAI